MLRSRYADRARKPIAAAFAKVQLDSGEFDVLGTLLRSGPPCRLRPTQLYRSLTISSSGLTSLLDRLEAAGMIRRGESAGDARSLPVELTNEGRRRAELAFREDMNVEAELLTCLTAREKMLLEGLLRKLVLALDDDEDAVERWSSRTDLEARSVTSAVRPASRFT